MDQGQADFSEIDVPKLLRCGRDGDAAAVASLLDSCRQYLTFVSNQELDTQLQAKIGASDIVQQTMVTAQSKFSEFHGDDQASLLAWLKQILINDLSDARRRFRTQKRNVGCEVALSDGRDSKVTSSEIPDHHFTPSTRAQIDEEAMAVRNAMQSLPPDYQKVIELRTWEKLSFEDIGKQMDRSAEAARKLWTRAVQALQQNLSSKHD